MLREGQSDPRAECTHLLSPYETPRVEPSVPVITASVSGLPSSRYDVSGVRADGNGPSRCRRQSTKRCWRRHCPPGRRAHSLSLGWCRRRCLRESVKSESRGRTLGTDEGHRLVRRARVDLLVSAKREAAETHVLGDHSERGEDRSGRGDLALDDCERQPVRCCKAGAPLVTTLVTVTTGKVVASGCQRSRTGC